MSVAVVRPITLFTVVFLSSFSLAQTSTRILVTRPVDESQLTVLKGNTHPLARAEFDRGAAPADLPMSRMLLVLKRSDEQESALKSLIDNQQDKASPTYHKWLTPEQFGKQFGPSDQDIAQVTSWLQSHGFQIAQVSKGRTVIEFSGTAAQVQEALHTSIHKYAVDGEEHWANSNDPQIPAALTPVVAGVLTLHNFLKKPHIHILDEKMAAKYAPGTPPQFTSSSGKHALTPADYSVIYNISPQTAGSGGPTIAIVGRSNINSIDINTFHSVMGDHSLAPGVIINGPDPGNLGGGEEAEAVLDTTWSGAVAPNATVTLVISASTNSTDGVDLSEVYIIDNNLADVMSESFGGCEANASSADASAISSLAQQAAAEGITYIVSTGDSGAAGCDDPNSEAAATGPFSVNILASSPYTMAVGGTMFNENGQDSTYWSTANSPSFESALSYIPEKVWNESCSGAQCGSAKPSIWSGSGGASMFFQKPSWQTGFGDTSRDLPDVSLTAAGHDPYLLCLDSSCTPDSQGLIHFAGIAGTSAAAPAFAGIMAQVAQSTGSRQGQANYVLYKLAATELFSQCNGSKPGGFQVRTCVFNDVTLGNNSVPGDTDYGTVSAKYQASPGYDLATGLGSVNVTNLLAAWNTATFNATTTTASISPFATVHGAPINVSIQVTANGGKPSGTVWLQSGNRRGNLIGDNTDAVLTLDSTGSASITTHVLLSGTYPVSAHYAGDGTYAPSDSTPVTVSIQPEPSVLTLSLLTTDQAGNFVPYGGGTYGIPIYLKAHVAGQSGYGVPTSFVDFSDNGQFIYYVFLDGKGDAVLGGGSSFTAGPHSATAQYQGDGTFEFGTSAAALFVVTQAATTISATAQPNAPQGVYLTATLTATSSGQPPSGSVTFYSGNTSLGSAPLPYLFSQNGTMQGSVTLTDQQLINGQYSITAVYSGDNNYATSKSTPVNVTLQPDFSVDLWGADTNTITRGTSAIFQFTLNFNDGFAGTVNMSCSGLPSESSCTPAPATITASGTGASLTITTKAPGTATLKANGLSRSTLWAATLGSSFVGIFLLGVPSRNRRLSTVLSLVLVAFLVVGIGCGGGGSSSPSTTPSAQTDPGTPLGTYTITVTGTSGTVSHNLTYKLTVQ